MTLLVLLAWGCAPGSLNRPGGLLVSPVSGVLAEARELAANDRPGEALARLQGALDRGVSQGDVVRFEMVMLLILPEVRDYDRAHLLADQIILQFPDSPYRQWARAMDSLIEDRAQLMQDREEVREDLKRVLDIDVEAERARRGE
ncbi:MAG: hypothetical protein ACE5FN_05990 [Leptospirillia bacterium]